MVKLLSVTELGVDPYGNIEGNSYQIVHFLKNGQSYWFRSKYPGGSTEVVTAGNSYGGYYYGIAALKYSNPYNIAGAIRLG